MKEIIIGEIESRPYKANILLVEDDPNMGFLVKDYLEMTGYQITLHTNGEAALAAFYKEKFHLCVLDVMLPQKDGFTLATDIRRLNTEVPILFLTAKDRKEDRIRGFRVGGDDYLTKPFSIEELALRIEAILKRIHILPSNLTAQFILQFGQSTLDIANQKLLIQNSSKDLTYRETKLLQLFCRNQNKLLERDLILKAVWEDEGVLVGRSVDVFVSRLRKLLKEDETVKIVNVHGVGYRFEVNGMME